MKAAAAALLALALAGCEAGPDYHGPPADVVARPSASGRFAGGGERAVTEVPLPPRWWHLYNDARLDSLVGQALAANIDLRRAEADIREAVAVVREVQATRTPMTALSGGAGYAQSGVPTPSTAGFVYSIAGSVTYPVDLFGGIQRGIEAARANAEAAVAARDAVRVTVAAGVTRAYVDVCSANRSYAAANGVLTIQRRTLSAIGRLFRGGRATVFDVTRAREAVDQSAAGLPNILAGRQAALFQLAALLGTPPAEYPLDVVQCPAPPVLGQPLPVGNGGGLLRRRPDIRQAEREVAAATATVGVNVANLYPQISLGGQIGSAGPVSLFASNASLGFSLGPLVTWSFPNQLIVRAQIAQAGAAAAAAAATFDATVITALQQTETAMSAYARQIDATDALLRTRADAGKANAEANLLYLYGRTDFLDVLNAEASLASAESALAQSQAAVADDQVALFQTLGGGWQ